MLKFNENKSFCIDLGIPTVSALKPSRHNWPSESGDGTGTVRTYRDPGAVLEETWMRQLQSAGLDPKSAIIFYKGKGYEPALAHTDVSVVDGRSWVVPCAINWTIGGNGSTMRWYRDSVDVHETVRQEGTNLPLMTHPLPRLTELHRSGIPNDRLVLVRTDIPHRACSDAEARWCISLRFADGLHESWDDAVSSISRSLNPC